MKKFLGLFLVLFCSCVALAAPKLGEKYELSKVIEVEGRQGIAVDEDFYYISSSTALYKYDKTGKLIQKNTAKWANERSKGFRTARGASIFMLRRRKIYGASTSSASTRSPWRWPSSDHYPTSLAATC